MDATHYWLFAREYSVLNAAVTAQQFWAADLEPHILSNAIERVYTAFFCSDSAQQLRNQWEEIIFSHFVTTLNGAFEWGLAQEDEGYKSGSESLSIPTPQKSTRDIPCFYKWKYLFWPYHTTYYSCTTPGTLPWKIQKPQQCMLPFDI